MAEPIGGIYVLIDGDYAPLIKALQEAEKIGKDAADKFGQSWGELGSTFQKLGSDISSVGATLTAAITVPLVGVSTAALLVSGSLEQANVAFKTLLGSTIQAQNHLDELKKFALSTPFEFPDLVQASKRLQALGFTAQEIIPTLTAVGNAASALGTGALGIERITLALGQMQAKGKVSAGEMKQLAEAGIPAWQILADAISKAEGKIISVSQVMKRSEDGFIDGNMAVTALIEGMQKKFAGLMEAQAKTLLGVWSNFKDQVTFVLGDIGDALAPLAKKMLVQFSEVLKTVGVLVTEFKKLPVGVQAAAVGFAALAAAAGPVLFIVGQLTSAVGSIISLWAELGLSMASVTAAVSPWAAAFAVVAASIAAIHFTGLDDEIIHFVSTVKNNFNSIVALFSDVIEGVGKLIKAFEDLTGIGPVFENLAFGFKSMDLSWRSFFTAAMPQFAMLRDALAALSPIVERIGGSYQSMATAAKLQLANLQAAHTDLNNKLADDAQAEVKRNVDRRKSLEAAAAAAEAYAKKVAEAFSKFGLVDQQKEIKELQAAYDTLAKSGKASAAQLVEAHGKVNQKLYEFANAAELARKAEAALALEFERLSTKFSSLRGIALTKSMFPPEWLKEQKEALALLEKLHAEMDRFQSGQQATAGIKGVQDQFKWVGELAEALKSLSAGSVEKLREAADLAAKDYQILADNIGKVSIAQRDLDLAMELALQKRIQLKATLGQDATSEIEQLENLRQKTEALIIASTALGEVYVGLNKAFLDVFSNIDKGLTNLIVHGGSLKDVLKSVLVSFEEDVVGTFVHGFTEGLKKSFIESGVGQAISGFLTDIFKKVFGGLFELGGKAITTAPQIAATTANTTAISANTAAVTALTSAISAQGAAGAAASAAGGGGGLGGLTDLASPITAISTAVTAITSVLQYLQGRRMEQDIGRIEVTTRGILNEALNLRSDEWMRENHLMLKLDDIWNEIRNVVEVLRLFGQVGGSISEELSQQIAEVINSNPHQTGDVETMKDIVEVQQQSIDATNQYNMALETTASTAYELDEAVSSTTSSLYALNEATKQVNGALPAFVDGMDRAVFNSMAGQQGKPGQNLSSGGPRMNMTPIIMPVPTMDAITGNGGLMQGSMMSHQNTQLSYPTIAPVVGGPGVTRQGAATVYVTAVDPTSRSVTQGIVTGLEEVGIRVR